MRHVLILSAALLGSSLAAPLLITPSTQQTQPGALVILSASEEVNWSASGGTLGSTRGTRIVLEAPRTGGTVTITVQDPKDATRKAFAVVQVVAPAVAAFPWRTHTFAAGASFSTAVSADGSLWTWGLNTQFQVPGGKSSAVTIPVRSEGMSGMVTVGASRFLNADIAGVALAKNGTLWAWGTDHPTPAAIDKNLKYADYNFCLVDSAGDGRFTMSDGMDRSLSPLKTVAYVTSVQNSYDSGGSLAVLSSDGTVAISRFCISNDVNPAPVAVDGLTQVTDVTSIFEDLSIALRRDGTAVLIDSSNDVPTYQDLAGFSGIRAIASSGKRGGGGWGYAVMNDGTVRGFVLDDSRVPSVPAPVAGLAGIVDVSVSGSHALFLRRDGTLFALGLNGDGELGNGTTQDTTTPVEVIGVKATVR